MTLNRRKTWSIVALLALLSSLGGSVRPAAAFAPGNDAFQRTWARTDQPVISSVVARTWMWGPEANTEAIQESYAEAPNGARTVQYYDKSRMEITDPNGDQNSIWYVTNGLLVVELITGRLQLGDNTFEQHTPSQVNVAGDGDDPSGPTYSTFGSLLHTTAQHDVIDTGVHRDGSLYTEGRFASYGIGDATFVNETQHWIAGPFWDFMNSSGTIWDGENYSNAALFQNPYYATGYPIIDPYWANVKVGGNYVDVLIQCFERRCLTYTPGNSSGFQTEAGNVGQHYHTWRYEEIPNEASGPCPETTSGVYIYVADQFNDRIEKFTSGGQYLCSWGGGLPPESFIRPFAVKSGVDGFIYVLSPGGISTFNHRGGFINYTELPDSSALDFAVNSQGHFIVPSVDASTITEFDSSGNVIHSWGSHGSGDGQFDQPWGVAVDDDDNVYVVDHNNNRIEKFSPDGQFLKKWGQAGSTDDPTSFDDPIGITVGHEGIVYVTDNGWVKTFGPEDSGYVITGAWGGFGEDYAGNYGLAVNDAGKINVYVGDTVDDTVNVYSYDYSNDAQRLNTIGSPGSGEGQFDNPVGVAILTR